MRGKDTLLKFCCLLLATIICLYGCSNKETKVEVKQEVETNDVSPSGSGQPATPPNMDNHATVASIKSIDLENNTITISSMFNKGGMMPDVDSRSGASNMSEAPENFNPDNKQENAPNGEMKQMPEGMPNNIPNENEGFNPQDIPPNEDQTLYVIDTTQILDKEGSVISISDLQVNDFIEYEVDGENLVTLKLINFEENINQIQK